jgi:hypothetical protein
MHPGCADPLLKYRHCFSIFVFGQNIKSVMTASYASQSTQRPCTYGKFWDAYTQGPDILESHLGSRSWGTTTQARPTLLDAWSDANETSHGRSSHLGEVLRAQAFLSRFSSHFSAVSEPFVGQKWWKIGFLGCSKAIFAAPRVKTSPS